MNNKSIESIILKNGNAPKRLLVSFAHPDDESFGPAGTQIHYANQGVAVHYICGTRGEAGSVDKELLQGYNSLGELRTQELLCAAKIIGFSGLHFLNYHDSGMENTDANNHPDCLFQAPIEEIAAKITRLIRQIKPQVVLTFDPTGGYFHPDHIQMHKATLMAFHAASDPTQYPHQLTDGLEPYQPQKLYYTSFPRAFLRFIVKILPLFKQDPTAFGRNKDINLKRLAVVEQTVNTKIYVSPYFEDREKAAQCHISQYSAGPNRIPKFMRRWLSRFDSYYRVEPPLDNNKTPETDFFANINISE